jgi:hypothetical protein
MNSKQNKTMISNRDSLKINLKTKVQSEILKPTMHVKIKISKPFQGTSTFVSKPETQPLSPFHYWQPFFNNETIMRLKSSMPNLSSEIMIKKRNQNFETRITTFDHKPEFKAL